MKQGSTLLGGPPRHLGRGGLRVLVSRIPRRHGHCGRGQ